LFHEDDLTVVVPVMQNRVECGSIHILTHQEEFGLGDGVRLAVVRQFERVAKILQSFWLVAKDQKEVCAVFNVVANLVEPAFDVGIYNTQLSMS
jgi:hypothetical protein